MGSSIGSNIFDVAFGLPVPWLIYSLVTVANGCKCGVRVGSDGVFVSLLVLIVIVGAIIITIRVAQWKMTRNLGVAMFFMYFCYVGFSLGITPAKDYKVATCG